MFAGSFDTLTASAAAGHSGIDPDEVTELVWSLADKSLVSVEHRDGSTRYRLLETVRAVALGYSEAAGDAARTRAALGERYLADLPFEHRGNTQWRARLALEHATIVQLVTGLVADEELETAYALARISVEDTAGRASSRGTTRFLLDVLGSSPREGRGSARIHAAVAKMLAERGDLDEAQAHVDEACRLVEAYGAEDRLGLVLLTRAMTHLGLRDASEERLRTVERELRADLARPLPPGLRADTLVDLSMVAQALGDRESRHYLREAALIASEAEDHYLSMNVHNNLAEQELRAGDTPAAALHQREAMRLSAELVTAFGFILAARIAQPEGLDAMAVRLHSAADVMLEECGFELIHDDAVQSEAVLKAARQNLGDSYVEHVAAGRALTLAEALDDADAVFDRAMYSADAASS